MPEWTTACPGWEQKLLRGESIIPPPIYPDEAEQALAIFKQLCVVDLPKVWDDELDQERYQTFGECSDQWVFDFVAAIFGAYDSETGNQLIREFYLLISKKNTKSTVAAGVMLTALILCWREEEEHLILAPTVEVAGNSFKPAAGMVRADEELSAMFHIQEHIRTITHRMTRNSLKVVAADTDTVSGKKSGKVLVDEHWVFGSRPNAESMFMEATGGQVSRNEGWVIYLTTQSDKPPAGVFKDKLQYYRDVRDGKIHDPRSLGILYEFPEAMVKAKAYLDPANFHVTNPNLGRSVSREWIESELTKRLDKTDGQLQQFVAKHLNVEIGLALRSDRWAGADFWEGATDPCTFDELLKRCEVIEFGVDGGGLDDLLGAYAIGREKDTGKKLGWGHAWAHPSVLERRKEIAPALQDFARAGHLTLVKRVGDDVEELADIAEQIYEAGLLDKIGVDPVGLGAILDKLEERGIPQDKIIGISQGWKLGGAIKTAERWLAEGTFAPAAQPMMAWCVGNARIEPRANSILITKQASGSAKIDPLMAMFNAVTLMALNPPAATKRYQMFVLG
ncbi:terminase large subunit [Azorhizophilus paspali]|uniref:Terminase large subunit n=1 Tax=Azorhizophilus paspali TaxID=69963 RepID=A0ABV6SME5_AZOPA